MNYRAVRDRLQKEEPITKGEVSWKPECIEVAPPPISKKLKRRWSYFIQKVCETDPLVCPNSRKTRLNPGIGSTPAALHIGPPFLYMATRRTLLMRRIIASWWANIDQSHAQSGPGPRPD